MSSAYELSEMLEVSAAEAQGVAEERERLGLGTRHRLISCEGLQVKSMKPQDSSRCEDMPANLS